MLASLLRQSKSARDPKNSRPHSRVRPTLTALEDRVVPYALSGSTWANPNVSVSFMPDGTLISGYQSNLFSVYNGTYSQATWQREVARALQSWANVSNLNFHFVPDDGSAQGTAGLAQGDSRFGDIRIGGYSMGSGILGLGWNPGGTTTAGDVTLNTSAAFPIGSIPDLASVVMHEAGHGIGFNHSLTHPSVMEGGLWGTYSAPYADDIAGVQAMYGARRPDSYDAAAANGTLGTATTLSLSGGGVTFGADVTTMADVDFYRVVVPSSSDGSLTVSADARNLSLFAAKVSVLDASGTLVTTASSSTYGDVATVHLTGLVAGQTYYLQVAGATTDVFGMGAYRLSAQFGGSSLPPPVVPPPPLVPPPAPGPTVSADRYESNDTPGTARNLGTVSSDSEAGLTIHTATDVDYFSFSVSRKGTYTISTAAANVGNIDLAVFGSQSALLATATSATGNDSITVSLAAGQTYTLKVNSPAGQLNTYDLAIAKGGGKPGKGGGYLHLGGPGIDSAETSAGSVSGLTLGGCGCPSCTGAAALNSSTSTTMDGVVEQSGDQVTAPVEFLPAERGSGRPESPGRSADAPGAVRSLALRLLMDLDTPGRD